MEKDIKTLLEKVGEINKKVEAKYKLTENLGLNIFEYISDKYYYENFHSDIWKAIFEHHNLALSEFIDVANKISPKIENKYDEKDTYYYREYKEIDLLITDEKNKKAIIIENKINYAIDQNKQLYRYLKEINNEGYTVEAIIYTAPEGKSPDFSSYEKIEIENVESKLIIMPIFNNNANNLYHWIDTIETNANKNFYSFINQYKTLLTHLIKEEMGKQKLTELLDKIIEEKDELKSFFTIREFSEIDIQKYLLVDKEIFIQIGKKLKEEYFDEIDFDENYCRKNEYLEISFEIDKVKDLKPYRIFIESTNNNTGYYYYIGLGQYNDDRNKIDPKDIKMYESKFKDEDLNGKWTYLGADTVDNWIMKFESNDYIEYKRFTEISKDDFINEQVNYLSEAINEIVKTIKD